MAIFQVIIHDLFHGCRDVHVPIFLCQLLIFGPCNPKGFQDVWVILQISPEPHALVQNLAVFVETYFVSDAEVIGVLATLRFAAARGMAVVVLAAQFVDGLAVGSESRNIKH